MATSQEERLKRKRMHSPAATGEIRERRPSDISLPASDYAHGHEDLAPSANASTSQQTIDPGIENRFTNLERMMTAQQELLQKLVSAQEPPPPPLPSPSEIYENARKEAQFVDAHHWDSLYIHGLVRIDGEISRAMKKDPPCEPCEAYNRVCIVLAKEDPYREFLFVEKNVCCGWCEYATIPSERNRRNQETCQAECLEDSGFSGPTNHQKRKKDKSRVGEDVKRMSQYFINGDGIDKEIISQDISRHLGNNAVVRPGIHKVCLSLL